MRKLLRTELTLKKRTDSLGAMLRQSRSEYQLTKAAEKVRIARIRVLQAKIGETPTVLLGSRQTRMIANLTAQIELLRAKSPADILLEFRQ